MTEEYTLTTQDGVKLYARCDAPDAPRAAVLIVHGLCEHGGRYDYVAERLVSRGYMVYRFDHRGHGRSEGQRVFYPDKHTIGEDVDLAFEAMRGVAGDLPLFVIGHSMGGYAATLFGTMYPGKARGFVLSGAWTRDVLGLAKAAPEGMDPGMYVDNALGDGVCSDPAVVAAYAADPLVEKKISLGLFYRCQEGQAWLVENAARFTDSVVLMHGASDGLVSPQDSILCYNEIGSTDKSLFLYAGLMHEIFNEPCRDRIIDAAALWLDDRSSRNG